MEPINIIIIHVFDVHQLIFIDFSKFVGQIYNERKKCQDISINFLIKMKKITLNLQKNHFIDELKN
ncbi:hypothetical protein IEQ34_004564 [Dendrobium chrysotoxum]|uniref:Uncharacterized protein n=1 Tax=Dendrobium chrysotoxum TaxID=161865 RepID=A0AAV7HE95_DENCH|nr:hypothetical protein IEQ34_004564 [Dendrobium chrysotoxum]